MAFLVFLQNFGTSIGIVLSNTIFSQTLSNTVTKYAPSVTPQAALEAGSDPTAVRHLVDGHPEQLNGVLMAYSQSLRNIFYFLVGISSASAFVCLGMGWVDVRKKKEVKKTMAEDEEVRSKKMAEKEMSGA
jgi:hypothetical protein